jgi:LysR family transcriptional regulator for metE and metH
MPTIETRHLALLVALDDGGSLVSAAQRLHLTPSALSQQLRDLEERVGGTLFHREWRRLTPNLAGRHLIDGARTALGQLARLEEETRRLLEGAEGVIRVASACQQSYRWLPETEYEVTGSSRAQRSVDGVSPPLSFVLCKAPALGW